jgi:hypothetical protein
MTMRWRQVLPSVVLLVTMRMKKWWMQVLKFHTPLENHRRTLKFLQVPQSALALLLLPLSMLTLSVPRKIQERVTAPPLLKPLLLFLQLPPQLPLLLLLRLLQLLESKYLLITSSVKSGALTLA